MKTGLLLALVILCTMSIAQSSTEHDEFVYNRRLIKQSRIAYAVRVPGLW